MWPARAHGIQLCSLLFCSGCCSDWAECRDATWNAIRCPVPLLSSLSPLPLFFTLLLFFPTFIVVVVISAITSNECGGRLYRLQTYPGLCSSSLPLPSSSRSLYENCYLAQCRRFPAVPSVTLPLSLSLPHSEIKSHRLPMTMKLYQLYSGFFPWPGATAFVLAMLGSFAN